MILVTGCTGFLGKRVCHLLDLDHVEFHGTSMSLGVDFRDYHQVERLMDRIRPTSIINCASFVGGIQYGYKYPADLFHNNMLMVTNLLKAAKEFDIQRVVNPISNCAYPSRLNIFHEDEFWDGPLHDSVLVYGMVRKMSWVGAWAYAKQHGVDVTNLILSNMYGPDDHFHEERSHALGALIMKFVNAERFGHSEVVVWGTGAPVREWLYVDDGAMALIRGLTSVTTLEPVNVGVGKGITIGHLAELIKELVGFQGNIVFDTSKPDGAHCKTVDGRRGAALLGWSPSTDFFDGLSRTIDWYRNHLSSAD